MYINFKDSKREYNKLENLINKLDQRIEIEQKVNYNKITIKSLKYVYPVNSSTKIIFDSDHDNNHETDIPFELTLKSDQILEFSLGQIIRLDGDSGNGKSTFSDIINSVIPFSEYSSEILLDNYINISGFDYLTTTRYYNEQQESICWKPSVYEIITGKNIGYDKSMNPNQIDLLDEDIVWNALSICSCLDFLKRDKIKSKNKWIHTKNIGISGGQKGRIALARSIYRIMVSKPKIVTLDEVDKSIQTELVVNIMRNIFDYTKKSNILVFIIAHSSEVKQLKFYNQVIRFEKGLMYF